LDLKTAIFALRRQAPHDHIVKRMSLAAPLKLNPINKRAW
jgi:hypothetical protein